MFVCGHCLAKMGELMLLIKSQNFLFSVRLYIGCSNIPQTMLPIWEADFISRVQAECVEMEAYLQNTNRSVHKGRHTKCTRRGFPGNFERGQIG